MQFLFRLFEVPANLPAESGRNLTLFLVCLSVIFTAIVFGAVIFLCVRYQKGSQADRSNPPIKNWKLETLWIGAPLVLGLITYGWSASLFVKLFEPPPDAEQIYVLGKQWMWKIYRPEGPREINELHLLKNKPVLLLMTSQDVVHDFFVPDFKVKMDVLPNRFTQLWFQPTRTGTFWIFCAQYCGTNHAIMRGKVIVLDQPEFDEWKLNAAGGETLAASGENVFKKLGCEGCHTLYSRNTAPSLYNLSGHPEILDNGERVIVDENYLRESIVSPSSKIVRGYSNQMPTFEGRLSTEDLMALVAYIKTLKTPG